MNEHWQILVAAIMIMGIFDGLSLWATRFIVARTFAGQRDQYRDQLSAAAEQCKGAAEKITAYQAMQQEITDLKAQLTSSQAIKEQVLELKAVLPLEYVRKEDFIRHEVVINAKLDRIFDKVDSLQGGSPCK